MCLHTQKKLMCFNPLPQMLVQGEREGEVVEGAGGDDCDEMAGTDRHEKEEEGEIPSREGAVFGPVVACEGARDLECWEVW